MCREEWDNTSFEIGYTIALLILLLVGPVVTMTIAYMLIAVTLWIGMKMDTQNELGNTFSVCLCIYVYALFRNATSYIPPPFSIRRE